MSSNSIVILSVSPEGAPNEPLFKFFVTSRQAYANSDKETDHDTVVVPVSVPDRRRG